MFLFEGYVCILYNRTNAFMRYASLRKSGKLQLSNDVKLIPLVFNEYRTGTVPA